MVKLDLLRKVSEKTGVRQADIAEVLEAYADVVVETLKNDKAERVPLLGIGSFTTKHVDAKSGVTKLGGTEKAWSKDAEDQIKFTISKSVKTL